MYRYINILCAHFFATSHTRVSTFLFSHTFHYCSTHSSPFFSHRHYFTDFFTCFFQAAFEFLANDLVLPAVRSALVNEWEVKDPTPALTLAEALVSAGVGDEIVQSLLMQVKRL